MKKEPAAIIGGVVGLLEAIVALVAVSLGWSGPLTAAAVAVVAAAGGVATSVFVVPVGKLDSRLRLSKAGLRRV